MEIFRVTSDIYGQETLLGVSWDLLYPFVGASVAFIVIHAIVKFLAGRRKNPEAGH